MITLIVVFQFQISSFHKFIPETQFQNFVFELLISDFNNGYFIFKSTLKHDLQNFLIKN